MSALLLAALATAGTWLLSNWLPTGLAFVFAHYVRRHVKTRERAAIFENLCRVAYGLVANAVALTPTSVDDKLAHGLEVLADLFKQAGLEITDDELALAKQRFDALHGEERAAASALAKTLAAESKALSAAKAGNVVTGTTAAPVLFGE